MGDTFTAIESKFKERMAVEKPACPFCTAALDSPPEHRLSEMPMGSCSCGAVYVCDITGHNLGSALVDAIVSVCDGDSEAAWNMVSDVDYSEKQLKDYDHTTHQIIHGGVYQGRRIAGVLLFVRLKKAGGKKGEEQVPRVQTVAGSLAADRKGEKPPPLSKQAVEALVGSYDWGTILAAAESEKKILRSLKRILYSPDDLQRWRAAEILGRASAVIARKEPEAISKLIQDLFSSVADTAASPWGAIDAIGEIIKFVPDPYSNLIPRLALLSRDPSLLENVLRALTRIGGALPETLHRDLNRLIPLLEHPAPRVQGYAAMLIGQLSLQDGRLGLERLRRSEEEIPIYEEGNIQRKTVGRIAEEALARL